jgi:integrase/recombinase XerD
MSDLRFAQAVESYRLYCRARGLAPRTLETYFFALEALHSFLASDQSDPPIPSSHELRAFIAHMLDLNLSRGTIRIRMRAVRAFCGFLVREQLVKANPFAGVDIPRVPTAYPAVLSVEDVQRLVGASRGGSWMQVRNHAIILTLLDTGIRLGELLRLNWEDVDLGGFAIRIRHGKGEKERHVFMGRCLHRALRRWLDLRGVALQQGPLYVTRPGVRLEKRIVQRIVARTAEGSGLTGTSVHPHLLRHTFATHYIMNGGDPFSLQRILGHSDIKTTMIYVNLAGVGLREAHAKASPVDRLMAGR